LGLRTDIDLQVALVKVQLGIEGNPYLSASLPASY
jgi:hypothetical protein